MSNAGERSDRPWLDGVEGGAGRLPISSDKKYIQVVAGPGSGKTFGLKRRVQRLVKGQNVAPKRILVGTFTRAIAKELRISLAPPVQVVEVEQPIVSTLHSQA